MRHPRGSVNNGWFDTWVDFEGQHIAHYENSETYFVHSNQVGTAGMVTDYTGALVQDELHYPWGQAFTTIGTPMEERFASLHHRDSATNLDPTHFRMYSSDEGRWLTPDPAEADIYNPQSMSRYAYALNNPAGVIDPAGSAAYPLNWAVFGYVTTNEFSYAYPDILGPEGWEGMAFSYGGLGFVEAISGAYGLRGGNAGNGPFSAATYTRCSQKCFGNATGSFGGHSISFLAASYLVKASQGTGESVDILAGTYLIESGSSLTPFNRGNTNGTVDIGPMQLNSSNQWPAAALGTNRLANQQFNGSAYQNILAGARFLRGLPDPGDYYSWTPALRQVRDNALNALTPELAPFFGSLEGK